jgi:hypothetical protein
MFTRTHHHRASGLAVCLLLLVGPFMPWAAADHITGIEPEVFINGEEVGFLDIQRVTVDGDEGLIGFFQATKQNPDGTRMTLRQFEASLGQGHLQWFQKVVQDNNPPRDAMNQLLVPPYIDPPNDGFSNQWADELPWYFDDHEPTPAELGGRDWSAGTLLANNIRDQFGVLFYHDGPETNAGDRVSFVTFLVYDHGDQTYSVLAGFSWSILGGGGGLGGNRVHIETLEADAVFLSEYADEIAAFGYTFLPEPPAVLLMWLGMAALGLETWRRRRFHVRSGNSPAIAVP